MNKEESANPWPMEVAENTLLIRCFGGLSVSSGDKTIPSSAWRGQGARAIFVYLVLNGRTAREKLMEMAWPNRDPEAAGNNFNSMVRYIRQALQVLDGDDRNFITRDGVFYAFRPMRPHVVDVCEFQRRIEMARQSAPQSPEQAAHYGAALQLYRGPFLPELYNDWATREQAWLQEMYLNAGWALGHTHFMRQAYDDALSVAQAMLQVDTCCEEAYRLALEVYLAMEAHVKGLRQYQWMEQALARELEVKPGRPLQALHQRFAVQFA